MEKFIEFIQEHIIDPIDTFIYSIKTDIDMLIFFHKNKCYFHWDYEFMYLMMEWKLKHMMKQFREENILADTDTICQEIKEAIDCIEKFRNPEDFVAKPDNNDRQYFLDLYNMECDSWKRLHQILEEHARGWWS